MHGFFIIINHSWRSLSQNLKISINKYLSWLVTFLSVNFSFVVFRAKNLDIAEHIYKGMLGLVQNNPFFFFSKDYSINNNLFITSYNFSKYNKILGNDIKN